MFNRILSEYNQFASIPPVQLSAQARHIHNRPIEVGGTAGSSGQLHFRSIEPVKQGG